MLEILVTETCSAAQGPHIPDCCLEIYFDEVCISPTRLFRTNTSDPATESILELIKISSIIIPVTITE
jgi:hypothetical protein